MTTYKIAVILGHGIGNEAVFIICFLLHFCVFCTALFSVRSLSAPRSGLGGEAPPKQLALAFMPVKTASTFAAIIFLDISGKSVNVNRASRDADFFTFSSPLIIFVEVVSVNYGYNKNGS